MSGAMLKRGGRMLKSGGRMRKTPDNGCNNTGEFCVLVACGTNTPLVGPTVTVPCGLGPVCVYDEFGDYLGDGEPSADLRVGVRNTAGLTYIPKDNCEDDCTGDPGGINPACIPPLRELLLELAESTPVSQYGLTRWLGSFVVDAITGGSVTIPALMPGEVLTIVSVSGDVYGIGTDWTNFFSMHDEEEAETGAIGCSSSVEGTEAEAIAFFKGVCCPAQISYGDPRIGTTETIRRVFFPDPAVPTGTVKFIMFAEKFCCP